MDPSGAVSTQAPAAGVEQENPDWLNELMVLLPNVAPGQEFDAVVLVDILGAGVLIVVTVLTGGAGVIILGGVAIGGVGTSIIGGAGIMDAVAAGQYWVISTDQAISGEIGWWQWGAPSLLAAGAIATPFIPLARAASIIWP